MCASLEILFNEEGDSEWKSVESAKETGEQSRWLVSAIGAQIKPRVPRDGNFDNVAQ